ncbi:transient receptor potential cation channel protein painless isoform X1 [Odontomachus brunneus]|uniref:transient receptor potential cation channel protein painless isoform X1 n=1 Tax=Odontomachus brunneus TaxID=486640 RepID=UPI0013F1A57A|nr:transient receptor potential cation channel protein painless isoform X1 [Odontomachus brunneus]XP_032680659.1 transient receptor potential cation channel protein painless isoform X1 [Odontomachus brunneus]XP_032680660.1 transient receptor potential cation channel protein painless isoform X1 [Odontomachus brunneus]XP_032680661.1 transient receptor potential cation channel protein painless isoform X1 [Odontomachus brunneus]XP_032680662.1 transient receptor potential cation channel protein pain
MELEEELLQEQLLNVYETTFTDRHVLYRLLLNALRSKDFHSFRNIMEHNLKKRPPGLDINYVFPNHYEETCLDIASRNGLTDFVSLLLSNGAMINRVNEVHNRAPIHFATENGHERTLAILLTHSMINVNLEAGQETALHIAVQEENLMCARQLLEARASANIPNSKGLTALHMAAIYGQREMVQLILDVCKQRPDLDSYRDYNDQTAREVIQENMPDLSLPPKCESREMNAHDLKYYLTVNDEVNFLRSLEIIEPQMLHGVAEDLLEIAAQHNFLGAVVGTLSKLQKSMFNVKRAAQIAVRNGHYSILRELLNVEPGAANDLVLDACLELGMPSRHDVDDTSNRLECLKLILEQEYVDIRCADDKGNTPLHYAARAGCHEAVTLLLERGSYIGHMNKFNVPPVADISVSTLSRYLDDCLQTQKHRTNEYTIEFDYRCLMPHVDGSTERAHRLYREMEVFQYIACNNGLKHLLKHPLMSSFLYLKWHRIRHFLCANFVFYVAFYLLVNIYILSTTYHSSSSKNKTINGSFDVALNDSLRTASWKYESFLHPLIGVMLLLFALREIIQLFSCPIYYFKSPQNWLELALIAMTFSVLCNAGPVPGAIVILISAWNLVLLISQHPRLSTGVEMFRTVSLNFVRFLFPYIFLILAFAFAFYTLFKDADDNFPDPGHSFFKTIIMLTGEFDADDISFESHPVWSHLVFIFFVFLIAIVLFNLLNGLAVSDTAEILCKAELVSLISRIRLVAYVEHVVFGMLFRHWFCCDILRRSLFKYLTRRILLFPNYLVDGKISIKPCDNLDAYDNHRGYTKYIRTESIKKYNRWATLKMDPNIIKKAKRIICSRRQLSDNERIMITMSKLQEKLTVIEDVLNTIKLAVENNNVNNTMERAA